MRKYATLAAAPVGRFFAACGSGGDSALPGGAIEADGGALALSDGGTSITDATLEACATGKTGTRRLPSYIQLVLDGVPVSRGTLPLRFRALQIAAALSFVAACGHPAMEPHLSGTATSVPVPRAAPANPVAATKKVLGTHVSAGADYTCAVLRTGAVKCWGAGDKLGLGDHENRGDDPNEMGDALPAVELGKGRTAISVSAGAEHTCAVLDSGAVKCWGAGSYGTLGLGDTKARGYAPNELGDALPAVDLGTGRTALAVSAGSSHTCAVLDTGAVKCWGRGAEGPLGLGDDKTRGDNPKEMGDALPAVNLGGGGRAVAVTAGVRHTCALLDTGAVKCWGRGTEDRQARGADPNQLGDALPAVDLGAGRTAVAVSAGYSHTCALLDTGAVKCWGYGAEGQLGLGDKKARGRKPNEMGDALPAVNLGGLVR